MTDGELLGAFLARGPGEPFEALVRRHGPMVLRVCRDVLSNPHAAEDAFQETFLVLARRADAIRDPDAVGYWLHGVATRVSVRMEVRARRRRLVERSGLRAEAIAREEGTMGADASEIRPLLHAEVQRLPEPLRRAVVLCYMEGRSYEAAARRLDLPLGTFKSRLARGRQLLRSRLSRRGVTASALLLLLLLTEEAPAVSPELVAAAARQGALPPAPATRGFLRRASLRRLAPLLLPALCLGIGLTWSALVETARATLAPPGVASGGPSPASYPPGYPCHSVLPPSYPHPDSP